MKNLQWTSRELIISKIIVTPFCFEMKINWSNHLGRGIKFPTFVQDRNDFAFAYYIFRKGWYHY